MFYKTNQTADEIIAANTRTKVFSVSYNLSYRYPYRMAKCDGTWSGIRDNCYELMLDSSYQNESITNRDVLQKAAQFNADMVFPKDYPGDAERTFESLQECLNLYEGYHDLNADLIPVLQPPHAEHYRAHADFYDQFPTLALGGLQDYDAIEQVSIIRNVRKAVGDHTHLHGFGIGTSLPLIQAMRNYSPFLDSIDVSTAEIAIRNGSIPDKTMTQQAFQTPYGKDSTAVRGEFARAILIMINYLLSSKANAKTIDQTYHEETALPEIHAAVEQIDVRSRHEINFRTLPETKDEETVATTLTNFSE